MVSRRAFLRGLFGSFLAALAMLIGLPLSYKWRKRMSPTSHSMPETRSGVIPLPYPRIRGKMSLEEAIAYRRSIRDYLDEPITLEELAQVLWAAQGVTETRYGFRAAPSAGATYPLEVYVVVVAPRGVVLPSHDFLEPGSYRYVPQSHSLLIVRQGDLQEPLYRAALEQEWVLNAPVNIVIAAVYERTTRRYGERGIRYVHMEVGHVGQNIYLQATALGLATVAVGAFVDEEVQRIIGAGSHIHPLYIMPLARPLEPYRVSKEELIGYMELHRKECR